MSKRDEAIGRAAFLAKHKYLLWGNQTEQFMGDQIEAALAAVAEARRLDTCETCSMRNEYMIDHEGAMIPCYAIGIGCNRHQPKEES